MAQAESCAAGIPALPAGWSRGILSPSRFLAILSVPVFSFEDFNMAVARLMEHVLAEDFGRHMADALALGIEFDDCLILRFHLAAPPEILYVTPSEAAGRDYAAGPYLLDPFYDAFRSGKRGCFRFRELVPSQGSLKADFLAHYRRYDIGDEIGLLLDIGPTIAGHVSLSRKRLRQGFAQGDVNWLAATRPLMELAMRRNADRGWRAPDPAAERLHDRLNAALSNFGRSVLTEREVEVTRWLLKGHSAKAIARELAISPGTVRNHLKSIYPKLGVTSHAELFARFFQALQAEGRPTESDPLQALP